MRETFTWLVLAGATLLSAAGAMLPQGGGAGGDAPALPQRPSRIVALSVPAAEVILALVEPGRVAALSEFVDEQSASNVVELARAVSGRVIPAAESIIPLQPDLVVLSAWADPLLVVRLHEAGIATYAMQTPTSLPELRRELRVLGVALGESEGADTLVRRLDARLAAVRRRVEGARTPTLLLYGAGGTTAAGGTLFPDLARAAGARPLAAEAGLVGFVSIGIEDLLSLDPEVLIDHPYRADGRARSLFAPRSIADDSRLSSLRAIREGRVVSELQSAHLLATTHHVASLVETLARALHPERFEDGATR